ncbi:DUF4368 domain-containing protein [Longibaculum muris]|nr:DUF4368 domain-containing protein [Coprobacillus cateniformis]
MSLIERCKHISDLNYELVHKLISKIIIHEKSYSRRNY